MQSLTNGGLSRNRTNDTRIFSPLLYQLSYETTWLREKDLNQRPPGYEPDELPDCSTLEECLHAAQLGFDFVGTTLVGYTEESKGDKVETNDFELMRKYLEQSNVPMIAEGNIDTPEKARRVLELGCFSVVVGSIITRPQLITKRFVDCIEG